MIFGLEVCSAGSRIYVQEGIYDQFLERFKALSKSKKLGDPFDPETTQGPQVSQTQLDVCFLISPLHDHLLTLDSFQEHSWIHRFREV